MESDGLIEELETAGYREDVKILLKHQWMIGAFLSLPGVILLILGVVFVICGKTGALAENFTLIGGIACGLGVFLLAASALAGLLQGPPRSPVTGIPMETHSIRSGNTFLDVYICHEGKTLCIPNEAEGSHLKEHDEDYCGQ